MQAQSIKISKLKANSGQIEGLPSNPRLIKDEKYGKLLKSIKEDPEMMDLRELIVYPLGGQFIVIGGNMRLKAMQELGYKEAPCKVLPEGTPVQKLAAYTVKDNVGFGEWDWEMIANEWDAEQVSDWGLDIPDFKPQEADAKEDDYEIPDEIKTSIVLGDLFEIGPHRLLCGDSTKSDDVAKLINGKEPYLMVTDPPYGVEYDAEWREERGASRGGGLAKGKVLNDHSAEWSAAYALSPSKVAYVWHSDRYSGLFYNGLIDSGFQIRSQIIWNKNQMVLSRGDYHSKHEPCFYAVKKGYKGNWAGDRKQTTVWDIDKPRKSETGHSTQKPVECMARPLANHDGDVHDPFLGSGTTMVAAHQLNRKCYGMELDPKYVSVILRRMKKLDPSIKFKCLNRDFDFEKEFTND